MPVNVLKDRSLSPRTDCTSLIEKNEDSKRSGSSAI